MLLSQDYIFPIKSCVATHATLETVDIDVDRQA